MKLDTAPSLSFCQRHRAISLLFANDPDLFDFLFEPEHHHLNCMPSSLVRDARHLPREKRVLAILALCIWTERGVWPVHEAYLFLSDFRYEALQLVFDFLGSVKPSPCRCHICRGASVYGEERELLQRF